MAVKQHQINTNEIDDYKIMLFGSTNLQFKDGNEFNLTDENVVVYV